MSGTITPATAPKPPPPKCPCGCGQTPQNCPNRPKSVYSTWARPMAPISPTVRAVAHMFLDTELPEGPDMPNPIGLLVGEQPTANHNPQLPLWPWPPRSAGNRLFLLSGLPTADYLCRLARVNLARRPVEKWDAERARHRALALIATLPGHTRVVLCGARARDAFEAPDWFQPTALTVHPQSPVAVAIPHPSGRSRAYNDLDVRAKATWYLRWAARV